jgi:hypothetical protein
MTKTRAAVLRKGGEPWEITELDLDEPKAGEADRRHHDRRDTRSCWPPRASGNKTSRPL